MEEAEQKMLPRHGGRIVKSLGDGLMLEFSNVQGCIMAAFALHSFIRQGNRGVRPEYHRPMCMGGHLASFVTDQHDIYGTDVNLASRISTRRGQGDGGHRYMRDRPLPLLEADEPTATLRVVNVPDAEAFSDEGR